MINLFNLIFLKKYSRVKHCYTKIIFKTCTDFTARTRNNLCYIFIKLKTRNNILYFKFFYGTILKCIVCGVNN